MFSPLAFFSSQYALERDTIFLIFKKTWRNKWNQITHGKSSDYPNLPAHFSKHQKPDKKVSIHNTRKYYRKPDQTVLTLSCYRPLPWTEQLVHKANDTKFKYEIF